MSANDYVGTKALGFSRGVAEGSLTEVQTIPKDYILYNGLCLAKRQADYSLGELVYWAQGYYEGYLSAQPGTGEALKTEIVKKK